MLTVETEVNGESKSTYERGPSLVGSLGLSCWYKRLLDKCKIFLTSPYSIIIPVSPSTSKLGRQPCWVTYFLVCVSKCSVLALHVRIIANTLYHSPWVLPLTLRTDSEGPIWHGNVMIALVMFQICVRKANSIQMRP